MLHNDGRWWQDHEGVWHHPEQGAWIEGQNGRWFPVHSSSGIGRKLVWIVGLGVLLGGCSFIVSEPVMALAIFFVGIPFAAFVVWLMANLMPKR